jgi:hypothetical protein
MKLSKVPGEVSREGVGWVDDGDNFEYILVIEKVHPHLLINDV